MFKLLLLSLSVNFTVNRLPPPSHDDEESEGVHDDEADVKSSAFNFLSPSDASRQEDAEAAAWILPNTNFSSKLADGPDVKSSGDLFFSEMDSFLDFDYPNPVHHSSATDSVVPVQTKPFVQPSIVNHSSENCFDMDFCRSKLSSFNYPSQSLSQSVSSSSLEVGVVPDGNSMSETSYSFGPNGGGEPVCATAAQATQLCGIDREARVLRYKEKRKNRKFEKTIRYASNS